MFGRCVSFSLLLLLPFSAAFAESRQIRFTGFVRALEPGISSEFTEGESLVGTLTFETTATDTVPEDNTIGQYTNAITEFSANIGGDYPIEFNSTGYIYVTNSVPDVYSLNVEQPTASSVGDYELDLFSIYLRDFSSNIFDSDALPASPPEISDFDPNTFPHYDLSALVFRDGGRRQFLALTMTSLQLVPEPSSFTLATVAFCLLHRRRYPQIPLG